ncbi:MAG: HAMP domain-containing sensor histidine kinase [Candidatus Paceibacterota bacterium]
MLCYLFPEPTYLIFSPDVSGLLYYAHIPATIISLIISIYIYRSDRHLLINKLLFVISILFSFWTTFTLIQWTNIHSDLIIFVWNFSGIILGLIAIFCIYFTYVFLEKKDISIKLKIIFLTLILPIILLTPSYLNLGGFNITDCDAFQFEQIPFQFYYTSLGVIAMIWILILLIRKSLRTTPDFKKQIILMGTGIELFLFSFFTMVFLSSYLTKIDLLPDSEFEIYGLFGMVIFMIYLSILMVRFKTFNVKLIATEALVWGLAILIGSQFFFIKSNTNMILNGITFVGIIVLGQILIKSVKQEVMQREQLQILTEQLFGVNEKLKGLDKLKTEFVSLASHQLRSPLTAIKGYASMLMDGDYGDLSKEAKEAIDRMYQSSKNLTIVVEDLLNVTKIESGGMKFEMAPFDLSKVVEDEAKDLSITAEKKGLKLNFESDPLCMTNGDQEKIRQVIINLIDNSIKYTKEGGLNVSVKRNEKKVVFCVKDTGMGMTQETKASLFQKFARGDGARMNTTGSGLGLYLARQIVEAHKGKVWVESDGLNKGSEFYMELEAI